MISPVEGESGRLVRRLLKVLSHLSWPAGQQRAYLAELGVAPSLDELALEFDDALKPLLALYGDIGINEEAQRMLASIDALFAAMGRHPGDPDSVWEWQALDSDSRWAKIRRMAGSVSAQLQNGMSGKAGDVE